ncbi:hypothetical protein [Treponema sp. OMZ 305]|uniref:hypothetical protein n=1 Tax=Treponema sp. OMZ 305 TaxID=1659192 RepID=UPI0020A3DCCD|nr:hypothetical protein [Treponema sp. OMZ 305]
MKRIFKTLWIPAAVCAFCLTACTTLPLKALYTEPTVTGVTVNTENNHFDVVYAINCCVMPKAKDDFISFKVDTMLYTYRLDFSVNTGMKAILDRFFSISTLADSQHRQNGHRYLGETTLYAYASSAETISRLVAEGKIANHVRFSFLLKDGKKYLLLEGFQVQTLDGKLAIDDYIDSIPFHYDDIKKAYDFFNDTDQLEENRQKQLQIAIAAKQAEKDSQTAATQAEKDSSAAVDTQEAGIISNSEKSSAENQ